MRIISRSIASQPNWGIRDAGSRRAVRVMAAAFALGVLGAAIALVSSADGRVRPATYVGAVLVIIGAVTLWSALLFAYGNRMSRVIRDRRRR